MSEPAFCLTVIGRLSGITWRRLRQACESAGGRAVRQPSSRVDLVVVAHSAAAELLSHAPPLELPPDIPPDAPVMSELRARRWLGLTVNQAGGDPRTLSADDISRVAGLSPSVLGMLSLFDIVDPEDGNYSFRDLIAAREVARLLRRGFDLATIVGAALSSATPEQAFGSGIDLSAGAWTAMATHRSPAAPGEQFRLALDAPIETADGVFDRAEAAESEGDLDAAERWYRVALRIDRTDPVVPFNLGNVLEATGRPLEASLAYRQALARDPNFAEAWLNLGVVAEARGRDVEAEAAFAAALKARPGYADGTYSFALFLTRRGRFNEAIPLWQQYILTAHELPDIREARLLLLLCRTGLEKAARQGGEGERPGRAD